MIIPSMILSFICNYVKPHGIKRSSPTDELMGELCVSGGHHYDKSQVILNTLDPNKPQQQWDVEVI